MTYINYFSRDLGQGASTLRVSPNGKFAALLNHEHKFEIYAVDDLVNGKPSIHTGWASNLCWNIDNTLLIGLGYRSSSWSEANGESEIIKYDDRINISGQRPMVCSSFRSDNGLCIQAFSETDHAEVPCTDTGELACMCRRKLVFRSVVVNGQVTKHPDGALEHSAFNSHDVKSVRCITVSPDNTMICIVSGRDMNYAVELWSCEPPFNKITCITRFHSAASWSHHGLVLGCIFGAVYKYDFETNKEIFLFESNGGFVDSICWLGDTIITLDGRGLIKGWKST